jgi:phosphatidylserine/phosphatidylglycerophosphate/cardiolipin synthase-like enzyme
MPRFLLRIGCLAGLLACLMLQPARAAGPVTFFTEPGAGLQPVLQLIRSAKHTIRLEIYLLTERPVINALGAAHSRGVQVRVLLEQHPYGGSPASAQSAFSALHSAGVNVRWANESAFTYTHEKAMVVDGQVAGIFTLNLSYSGIESNREFGAIDRQPADARTLAAIFDADWNRKRPSVQYGDLVISPYNSRNRLEALINSAKHNLDLYEEEINDTGVEGRLIAAHKRGVRVRLIISETGAGVDALRAGGVAVTIMSHPYVHAKAIVADGSRVFIGSENVSATSLDANREAGIIRNDRSLAGVVEAAFSTDWKAHASSTPPPAPPTATSSGSLHVTVTTVPTSVSRGQYLTIRAVTKPRAVCTVKVTYPDGYVSAAAVLKQSRTADPSGAVEWVWREGSTKTGTGHAAVTCTLGSNSGSGTAGFTIH